LFIVFRVVFFKKKEELHKELIFIKMIILIIKMIMLTKRSSVWKRSHILRIQNEY